MYVPTGLLFSIAFIVIGFNARVPGYKLAPVFLIPILWIPYLFRRWLHLNPYHFLLFALAMLLHDFGAFGFYQNGLPEKWRVLPFKIAEGSLFIAGIEPPSAEMDADLRSFTALEVRFHLMTPTSYRALTETAR